MSWRDHIFGALLLLCPVASVLIIRLVSSPKRVCDCLQCRSVTTAVPVRRMLNKDLGSDNNYQMLLRSTAVIDNNLLANTKSVVFVWQEVSGQTLDCYCVCCELLSASKTDALQFVNMVCFPLIAEQNAHEKCLAQECLQIVRCLFWKQITTHSIRNNNPMFDQQPLT